MIVSMPAIVIYSCAFSVVISEPRSLPTSLAKTLSPSLLSKVFTRFFSSWALRPNFENMPTIGSTSSEPFTTDTSSATSLSFASSCTGTFSIVPYFLARKSIPSLCRSDPSRPILVRDAPTIPPVQYPATDKSRFDNCSPAMTPSVVPGYFTNVSSPAPFSKALCGSRTSPSFPFLRSSAVRLIAPATSFMVSVVSFPTSKTGS